MKGKVLNLLKFVVIFLFVFVISYMMVIEVYVKDIPNDIHIMKHIESECDKYSISYEMVEAIMHEDMRGGGKPFLNSNVLTWYNPTKNINDSIKDIAELRDYYTGIMSDENAYGCVIMAHHSGIKYTNEYIYANGIDDVYDNYYVENVCKYKMFLDVMENGK